MLAVGALGGIGRLGLVAAAVRQLFDPRLEFFSNGEQGVWYDPSDLSTLFQDSAGTTPVTAVEQPVGLMLDKRLGLVPGSELRSGGTPGLIGSVTAATYDTSTGAGAAVRVDISNQSFVSFSGLNATVSHRIDISNTGLNPISVRINALGGSTVLVVLAGQRVSGLCSAASSLFIASGVASGSFAFTIHSIAQLPGNHAFQSTAIDRPILRNRYNLLTKTEQFDDAVWVKASAGTGSLPVITPNYGTDPLGGVTADRVQLDSGAAGNSMLSQSFSSTINRHEYGIWLRSLAGDVTVTLFCLDNIQNVTVTPTWQRFTFPKTPAALSALDVRIAKRDVWGSTGVADLLAWGASLVPADQASLPYQRVNTATDYDSDPSKFPLYLAANGTNTWMQTNSIDFSSTDKVTVFAGVRKLSDAATGVVAEISADSFSTNGSFGLFAPAGGGSFSYRIQARGTSTQAVGGSAFAPSPDTAVISAYAGIAAGLITLRRNGSSVGSTVGSLGTGNYGNYPLYLFRRGGTTLPFNGNFYGLLIRGALTSDAQTIAMERWLAPKTGVVL